MVSATALRPTASAPLLGLEVLRFACAVSVLLWHYNHFYVVGDHYLDFVRSAQPGYRWLRPFYEAGWLGVEVFWAISGFIFSWKYAQPLANAQVGGWRFAVLRFSRLYPLHGLTLLLVAGMAAWYRAQTGSDYVYQYNDVPHFLLQLCMASDWLGRNEWSFNGPIWSVSIELMAYVLFFVLCRLGWVRLRHCLVLIALMGAVYASKRTSHPLVLCMFFFYIGAATQGLQSRWGASAFGGRSWTLASLALAGLLLASAALAWGLLRPMFYVAALAPLSMLVLLRVFAHTPAAWAARIEVLGHMTYASYLLHFPLQLLVANLTHGRPQVLPLASPIWLLGYLGLTFALAVLVYRGVERPAQAYLRRRLLPVAGA